MSFKSTEYDLEQWGKWRRTHGISLGYGSNILAMQKTGVGFDISDEWALAIDGALAELKLRTIDSRIGSMVEDYFCNESLGYQGIGERFKVGKTKARVYVQQGISWIDARLESFREQAEKVSI